jgi:hypothetical protein
LQILNNGSQLVQVNVMKYTPSFSAIGFENGHDEVKELNGLLCFAGRMSLACTHCFLGESAEKEITPNN